MAYLILISMLIIPAILLYRVYDDHRTEERQQAMSSITRLESSSARILRRDLLASFRRS